MFDVYINDRSSCDLKVYPVKRPNVPAPKKKYKEYEILGRDGKLYQDLNVYDDVQISVEFNYMASKDRWHEVFRNCKKIFLKAKKLQFSDDLEYYHIIKKVEVETNERNSLRIGRFTVIFTLDPYYYKLTGLKEYPVEEVLKNRFDISRPKYLITGEGICHLNVNGTDVTCNVGQNLIIDTYLELAYRKDGTLQNTAIDKDYTDLLLLEGMNEISISRNFELKIIPNWRCL